MAAVILAQPYVNGSEARFCGLGTGRFAPGLASGALPRPSMSPDAAPCYGAIGIREHLSIDGNMA